MIVDILAAQGVLLAILKKTVSKINVRSMKRGPPLKTVKHLLSFLVVVLNESLNFVLKPFSEVVEVLVCHQLFAVRPELWVQVETFPREGDCRATI